jgi:hypothetical protein
MTEAERYADVTPFQTIYDAFYNLVTDDMYLEWTQEETAADLQNILLAAIPKFEFPRFKLYDYTITPVVGEEATIAEFNFILTQEEIGIFANLMTIEWIVRQVATCDVTKQKYSSKDFELTSQANHLAKLLTFKNDFKTDNKSLQRLYKRRNTDSDGYIKPNYSGLGGKQ